MYNDIMKMPERIETERLVLRVPFDKDALTVFNGWAQDKEVTRYLRGVRISWSSKHKNLFEVAFLRGKRRHVFHT